MIARHVVAQHGVRRLLLTSRRGPDTPGIDDLIEELIALGAEVDVRACDVGDRDELAALLDSISVEHPLQAVVHCAAGLRDGTITNLTPQHCADVLAPKADAAWHLHQLTRHLPLTAPTSTPHGWQPWASHHCPSPPPCGTSTPHSRHPSRTTAPPPSPPPASTEPPHHPSSTDSSPPQPAPPPPSTTDYATNSPHSPNTNTDTTSNNASSPPSPPSSATPTPPPSTPPTPSKPSASTPSPPS
ncbi:KR domain-containing protein, partial [Saccharothrix sp. NRRL B-16314]|uniref:KR domain-containing protein n=1 Tax=Saccharothrix sp. NRRL B-16314 TaxID=1463825 RepID=UPI0022AF617E